MIIVENVSLRSYNTFGVDVNAGILAEMHNLQDIQVFLNTPGYRDRQRLILGCGSNVLFTKDFEGVVMKISSKGILKISETEDHVFLNVQAGVIWDDFVNYCLQNDLGGVENLAMIPGNVGSAPIQNIGAYGCEVKDTIDSIEIVYLTSMQMGELKNSDCHFGYRSSIFKHELKDKVVIVSVNFKLTKKHTLNINYGAIRQELDVLGIKDPNIKDVAKAVCNIRRCKLPDPKDIGNAGSFFKNPSVSKELFLKLSSSFREMPSYDQPDGTFKIPAGWLIEQCGWKGVREGQVGVHDKQALVIVNYGNATGDEILQFAKKIQHTVEARFSLKLEMEVNII
jgi:UDP-N-acetylmuramate dehydrogenase